MTFSPLLLFLCAQLPVVALGFSTPISFSLAGAPTTKNTRSSLIGRHNNLISSTSSTRLYNIYDDWAGDFLSTSQSEYTFDELILPLDEDCVEQCLEELMDSEFGKTMFGRHDVPASVG